MKFRLLFRRIVAGSFWLIGVNIRFHKDPFVYSSFQFVYFNPFLKQMFLEALLVDGRPRTIIMMCRFQTRCSLIEAFHDGQEMNQQAAAPVKTKKTKSNLAYQTCEKFFFFLWRCQKKNTQIVTLHELLFINKLMTPCWLYECFQIHLWQFGLPRPSNALPSHATLDSEGTESQGTSWRDFSIPANNFNLHLFLSCVFYLFVFLPPPFFYYSRPLWHVDFQTFDLPLVFIC